MRGHRGIGLHVSFRRDDILTATSVVDLAVAARSLTIAHHGTGVVDVAPFRPTKNWRLGIPYLGTHGGVGVVARGHLRAVAHDFRRYGGPQVGVSVFGCVTGVGDIEAPDAQVGVVVGVGWGRGLV